MLCEVISDLCLIQFNFLLFRKMAEASCQTANSFIPNKRNSTKFIKINQVSPLTEEKQTKCQDMSPGFLNIQPNKTPVKRNRLPLNMKVTTEMSCSCALKGLKIFINNQEPYEIKRVKRFPNSVFEIKEITEKNRSFVVVSNFLGTKYNLFQNQQLLSTIVFQADCCGNSDSRLFSMYSLAPGTSFNNLLKQQKSTEDLCQLYQISQNKLKIQRFVNQQPRKDEHGYLIVNFGRRKVMSAVENAVLVDVNGVYSMEIVKLEQNVFQVSQKRQITMQNGVLLAIASLDFKWAIE